MTRWISIPEGVAKHIGVPVELLRVSWVGHQRVGAYEPSCARGVITGVVIIEANVHIVLLAGVGAVGQVGGGFGAPAAVGQVAGHAGLNLLPSGVAHQAGGAEVVGVEVVWAVVVLVRVAADASSYRLTAQEVGFAGNGIAGNLSLQAEIADGEGTNGRAHLIMKLEAGSSGGGRECQHKRASVGSHTVG